MPRFELMGRFLLAIAISLAALAARAQTAPAAAATYAHPVILQQVTPHPHHAPVDVLVHPLPQVAPSTEPPVATLPDPDAGVEVRALPEISWGGPKPAFIQRIYFAHNAEDTEPLATPAPEQSGAWQRMIWQKGAVWLIAETEGAPEDRRLCARWLNPAGEPARTDCKPLGAGALHLAFESPYTRLWPSGTYSVELYSAPSEFDAQAEYLGAVAFGAGGGSTAALIHGGGPQTVPQFPWPPPRPTTRATLDAALFTGTDATFGAIARRLDAALKRARYRQPAYYAVPDGFAMATRLEQIEADGTPIPEPERWNIDAPPRKAFSLRNFIDALFDAPEGHYRVIVFIVSDHPFATGSETITEQEADAWLSGGLNRLPNAIALRKFGDDANCVALIYEFVKNFNDPDGGVSTPTDFEPAETQLANSHIEIGQ